MEDIAFTTFILLFMATTFGILWFTWYQAREKTYKQIKEELAKGKHILLKTRTSGRNKRGKSTLPIMLLVVFEDCLLFHGEKILFTDIQSVEKYHWGVRIVTQTDKHFGINNLYLLNHLPAEKIVSPY